MLKLTYLASQVRLSITNYRDKSSIKYRKMTCFDVSRKRLIKPISPSSRVQRLGILTRQ